VPDIVSEADDQIRRGRRPQYIAAYFTTRQQAISYYALAIPRLTDEILGTNICHVCGRENLETRVVTARWRTQIAPKAFHFSVKSTFDQHTTTHHPVCARCLHHWSIRCEIARWVRGFSEHYGKGVAFLIVLIILTPLVRLVPIARFLGPAVSMMILAFPIPLITGRIGNWYSAPRRLRRLIHRSVACMGLL